MSDTTEQIDERGDDFGGSGDSDGSAGQPRWARFAALGLVLAAIGPLLMLAAAAGWGLDVGDDIGFFVITAAVALLGAWLMRGRKTWMLGLGILAAVLVAAALFWTAFGLFSPDSVFDFVPGVLVVSGVFIAIGAGIAAIRAQRRGDIQRVTTGGERKAMIAVPAVIAVLAALSAVLTLSAKESVSAEEAAGLAEVRLTDFEFVPDGVEVVGGETIVVRNDDPFRHTFTVDDLDIDISLSPGSEQLVEIPAEPGTYILYCEPHTADPDDPADDDMATELTVR